MRKRERVGVLAAAGACLTAAIILSAQVWAERITPGAAGSADLLRVKIHQLTVDPTSMQPVVFLADPGEERALLIWIGPCEANALNSEMEGTKHPRPLTHDLTERVIQKFKGKIQRIVITHLKEGIYYATLVLEREGSVVEMDARPSDSLVMALKFKAPIFVSKSLFQEASVPLKEEKGVEAPYGLTVQELNSSLARSFSFPSTKGVLVSDVQGGSRAEKDGLQRGDILVEVGGRAVPEVESLREALSGSKGPLKARIFRKGSFVSLTLHMK